jgi:c-di-GMP-binding flagellar brake protein YcgR
MEDQTILTLKWKPTTTNEIIAFFCILVIPILVIIIIKLYQRYKNIKIHDSQLFLFKLKRLGLSNFQIKIINNLIEILRFSNPNTLLGNPEFFESAVSRFLTHARGSGESEEPLSMISKDLSIIYDKIYYPTRAKKPIRSIQDLGENQLIYFTLDSNKVFIGKIISWDSKNLYFKTFGSAAEMQAIPKNKMHTFHIFRLGDAEYSFDANVLGHEYGTLIVEIPKEINRGEESRHPYIDVIIPAQISKIGSLDEVVEKISCTIYKINEYEAVLRVNMKLDINYQYNLEFNALEFNFIIVSKIIVEKTVEEESGIFYYNLKFKEMSAGASNVLKKFVYELL